MKPEFYVGYLPKMPAGLAHFVRRAIALGSVATAAIVLLLVAGQEPFPEATFEYGQYRSYEGELFLWPYPILAQAGARYLLVAPGKHGAAELLPTMDGASVRLQGSLITRDGERMLEIAPGSVEPISKDRASRQAESVGLGMVSVTGEIVDSKCYLGVMNPGNGKVHRDCAVRCISGGVPPALLVRDASGAPRVLLLTGSDGRALNKEVLDYVAEPIRVRGLLLRAHGLLTLKAEPRDFVRE